MSEPAAPAPDPSPLRAGDSSTDPGDPDLVVEHARAMVRSKLFDVPLPRARIGRFELVEAIGEGGMGAVFAARDPELDREVAIKLLHARAAGTAAERLLREARAMARLTHPNVVTVYEAGTSGEQVYLAMELVHGKDLHRFLAQEPRPWHVVVRLLVQAAHGLAAAHAAGLIHRDFKPANVLVTRDGVAKVADFGLARSATTTHESLDLELPAGRLEALTRTGAIVGTPAYLPPEVIAGRAADERGDQFSFCVAAFEAIYGVRPFVGSSLSELYGSIEAGRIVASRSRGVPRLLRRILLRGLRVDPRDRYPSMRVVAARLEATLTRRRRLLAGAGVLAAAMGVTAALAWPSPRRCTGAEDAWVAAWSPEARAEVDAAMRATGHPGAQDASERVAARLEDYGARFVDAHREACLATHERGEQSLAMLDLRMACLEERRGQVRALVELLRVADREAVGRAVVAAQQLPDLDACRGGETTTELLPADPTVREQVMALRAGLAQARARRQLGQAEPIAKPLVVLQHEADAIGHVPLRVDVRLDMAELQGQTAEARELLYDALHLAEGHGYVDGQRRAWTALTGLLPYLGAYDTAEQAAAHAGAFVEQLGNDPLARSQLLEVQAFARLEQSRFDEAVSFAEQAVHTLEAHDPEHFRLGPLYGSLGTIYSLVERNAEAKAMYERAYALALRHEGERSAAVGIAMMNLGRAWSRLDDLDASNEWYRRSIALYEELGQSEDNVALTALNNLGLNYSERGRHDEAIAAIQRAIAGREQHFGAEHRNLVRLRRGLAKVYAQAGRHDDAIAEVEHALAIAEATFGDDHDETATTRRRLGQYLVEAGSRERGLLLLERALEGHARPDTPPLHRALSEYWMFHAIADDPAERPRARELALAAVDVLATGNAEEAGKSAELRAWLDAQGQPRGP
jgi:tetratricopeptide (TPR) repeat protein